MGDSEYKACLLKQGSYDECDGEKKCIFHIHNNQLIIEKKTNTGMSRCNTGMSRCKDD